MLKLHKRAEAGIGTLVLFIAMILVAAIAAGVLIQTANSLQTKALATASQSKDQVATSVQFLTVYAQDASSDNNIEQFAVEMKLVPGSGVIKLEDGVFEFVVNSQNASSLTYGGVGSCDELSSISSQSEFTVDYLLTGTNNLEGYLVSGDVVSVCFAAPRAVSEDETVEITFIPRTGSITSASMTAPSVMTSQTVYLFP
ncbi:MAG: archaellin/type IV pilin N-terminal domain-containing protein [Candidatus Woesearchaeota archaeon]